MSMMLYYLFVFPLENLLGFLLDCIISFVRSEGVSVVLLSIVVNVFLLKIMRLTDERAALETKRKKELDTRIQAWKKVFNKTKCFAFTQTLYRQKHYHPIFALSALGGLFIQIPFFYAMYFVIMNHHLATGDTLSHFVNITAIDVVNGVYVLPIFMTLITLLNVFLSSKEKSARIQGAFIAFLFLILLYKMPSALVLYWTSNMAFSLVRTILRQKKERKCAI